MSIFTAEEARRRWEYDPDTGILRWKTRAARCVKPGAVAGCRSPDGYWKITWRYKKISVHRVIWLIVYGEWPDGHVDHINGVTDDNRLVNLRCGSRRKNQQNQKCHREGHLPGTTYLGRLRNKPWQAQIQIDGQSKYLGCFATQQEAHEAYVRAMGEKP